MYQIRFNNGYVSEFESDELSEVIQIGKTISKAAYLIGKTKQIESFHILQGEYTVGYWDNRLGFRWRLSQ